MAHHELVLSETPMVRDITGPARRLPRRTYVAARSLFKRGASYLPGDPIELDPQTAGSFLAAGDIKEMQ